MSQRIEMELVIGPDGEITLEVHGIKGAGCHSLSREVAAMVDADIVETRNTSEFYSTNASTGEHRYGTR